MNLSLTEQMHHVLEYAREFFPDAAKWIEDQQEKAKAVKLDKPKRSK